ALPFEAIDRVARRVSLRDHRTGKALAPVVVVTLAARQVQLTFAAVEQLAALIQKRPQLGILRPRDRQPTRLVSDKGSQSQEIGTLPRQRCGTLVLGAASVYPLLQIDRAAERRIECRITSRHPLHAAGRVAMAVRA